MLPGLDGIDVCRRIRAESGVPIVMLTAKTDTVDVVLGLESGADDYVVKPFKPKELVARDPGAAAPHRRARAGDAADRRRRRSTWPGTRSSATAQPINLTPLEFDLLVALARKPRQVFTREVLLEQVWGYRHAADTRLVNVHVQRLRAKIEQDPEHPEIVVTVRGVGYKAGPPERRRERPGPPRTVGAPSAQGAAPSRSGAASRPCRRSAPCPAAAARASGRARGGRSCCAVGRVRWSCAAAPGWRSGRSAARKCAAGRSPARRRWRRSLQLRVVTTTLVLSRWSSRCSASS